MTASPAPEPSLEVLEVLRSTFGFESLRPGQGEVISELLAGQGRALAIFPTGGGKSLCYQLPALLLPGITIVVSPLLALMKDQIDFLHARGVAAARMDSSLDAEQTRAVGQELREGALKLLYVAPERFNNERFRALLARCQVSLFAVDEAHCISEWGHNFRPDYLKLAAFARDLGVERLLALTATATPKVARSIREGFDIAPEAQFNTGFYRPNLRLSLCAVPAARRDALLAKRLHERPAGSTIVYVTLQKTAERLADLLQSQGIEARAYHAGQQPEERSSTQEWWMSGARVVVATIAFGMGIDKSDVRYIYHYNLPKGLESYAQEIGRAGRDGAPSIVELFACSDDLATLENFAFGDTPDESALRALIERVAAQGREWSFKEYDWSHELDLRPLVLKTALTYLELEGLIRQGTPFYAGYDVDLGSGGPGEIAHHFSPRAAAFVERVLASGKRGRTWIKIDTQSAVQSLGADREQVVRALELLEEKGLARVRAADPRQRFSGLAPIDIEATLSSLRERFERRERAEIVRVSDVLRLVEYDGCQTHALARYFGEKLSGSCGHCTHCRTKVALVVPPAREHAPIDDLVSPSEIADLRATADAALRTPRQLTRFLCGLSSPATSRARLGRHPLWGRLENHRFAAVLTWCQGCETPPTASS